MTRIILPLIAGGIFEYFAFMEPELNLKIMFGVMGMFMFAISIFETVIRGDY